jgi:hypothetical protein
MGEVSATTILLFRVAEQPPMAMGGDSATPKLAMRVAGATPLFCFNLFNSFFF